jgi:flagellar hook-associated protein 1 FlgK
LLLRRKDRHLAKGTVVLHADALRPLVKLLIDGVPLNAGSGGNTIASGSLAANLQLRDEVAVQMQRQLDEIARGLITAFAETDPAGALADAAGLFTWPGGPGLPAEGVLVDGLAGSIRVNPAMDSSAGGNPELLRDGGINGAAYVRNASGAASYSDLLNAYLDRLAEPQDFDPATSLGSTQSLLAFSSESIGWIESLRQDAARGVESKQALSMHLATALSNQTGVNLDEEMALLLELEHTYQASARLMAVVDEMMKTLLEATR